MTSTLSPAFSLPSPHFKAMKMLISLIWILSERRTLGSPSYPALPALFRPDELGGHNLAGPARPSLY